MLSILAPSLVAFVLLFLDISHAFCTTSTHLHGAGCHAASFTKVHVLSSNNLADIDETNSDRTNSSMMTLSFVGNAIVSSEPIEFNNSSKSLHDFFALPCTVELLLQGSKNNTLHEIKKIDSQIYEQYRQNCAMFDASLPNFDDRIYNVTTSGVKFPGLRVMSNVTIGAKLISASVFPSYELVLIRDSNYAEGSPLFVWFFNKVTRKDKIIEGGLPYRKGQTAFSFTRITAVPLENDMISFQANATLSLLFKFPSFLFKALHSSKEKTEMIGGKYLKKALDGDLPAALDRLQKEYFLYLRSR